MESNLETGNLKSISKGKWKFSFDIIQDEIGTPIKTNGNTEKLAGIYEAFPRILETPGVNIAQNDAFGVKKTFAPGP